MFGRRKVAMVVAEFLGTGVLALVVLAVQRSTIGIPYFVAIAAGLAVAALSLILSAVSGAHFNPAITIGLWSARKVQTVPALTYVGAQLLGGWAAYGVYTYFINSSLQKLGGHYTSRVLIAEAVGAFIFAFVWAAVAAQRLAASVVGAGLTLGIIVAASASIGVLNPAVAISERAWVVVGSTGWLTYALGPVIGAVVGFNLYQLLFAAPERATAAASAGSAAPSAAATSAKAPAKKPAAKKAAPRKRK
jgi:glycerol uptake facilitator-like aquaporin